MIFSYLAPSPALAEFVRDYLIAHFVFGGEVPAPCKPYAPRPEQGLTFFVRGAPWLGAPDSGGAAARGGLAPRSGGRQQATAVTIFGQQAGRCDVELGPEFLMVRVHLRPGALFRMLRVPLPFFAGDYCDAEPVLGRDVSEISERLNAARGYAEMIALVEGYLLSRTRSLQENAHAVDRAAEALTTRTPGRFSLDRLASQACMSPRHFNRVFTERVGVGPKLYSRLARFDRACRFKATHPHVDWLTVAIIFGYTDYQHLTKDFRQFTNTTPVAWVRQDGHSPERLLSLASR